MDDETKREIENEKMKREMKEIQRSMEKHNKRWEELKTHLDYELLKIELSETEKKEEKKMRRRCEYKNDDVRCVRKATHRCEMIDMNWNDRDIDGELVEGEHFDVFVCKKHYCWLVDAGNFDSGYKLRLFRKEKKLDDW